MSEAWPIGNPYGAVHSKPLPAHRGPQGRQSMCWNFTYIPSNHEGRNELLAQYVHGGSSSISGGGRRRGAVSRPAQQTPARAGRMEGDRAAGRRFCLRFAPATARSMKQQLGAVAAAARKE